MRTAPGDEDSPGAAALRRGELPGDRLRGDVRSRAVTLGKIADILPARGELDEALRNRRDRESASARRNGSGESPLGYRTKLRHRSFPGRPRRGGTTAAAGYPSSRWSPVGGRDTISPA